MRIPPPLAIAAIAAVGGTLGLWILRLIAIGGSGSASASASAESMLPALIAAGALCVIGLTITRDATAAWLATIVALSVTAVDLAALARTADATVLDPAGGQAAGLVVCLSGLAAATAAVAYASGRRRRSSTWVPVAGILSIGFLVIACLWAFTAPGGPAFVEPAAAGGPSLGTLNFVTRTFLLVVSAFTVLGLLEDAQPAARRARQRVEVSGPGLVAATGLTGHLAWVRAFADEIAPGRTRARQAAAWERSRIARELHAEVVPAVRRALAEAERGGSVERLARSLREVLGEVDALVASRHSVILDVGGLIPALEWLAERTEDRSDVRVTIDVLGAAADPSARPPAPVGAAAYRVAELALENVVRHAPASSVRIEIALAPDRVALTIVDDGPGIPVGAEPVAAMDGRRGLVDMRAEAAALGASLKVVARGDGPGTAVRFQWARD
jgi:signal transduction histidine kinase